MGERTLAVRRARDACQNSFLKEKETASGGSNHHYLRVLPLYTGKLVATEKKTTNTDPRETTFLTLGRRSSMGDAAAKPHARKRAAARGGGRGGGQSPHPAL